MPTIAHGRREVNGAAVYWSRKTVTPSMNTVFDIGRDTLAVDFAAD
jgi:hypothetical protein